MKKLFFVLLLIVLNQLSTFAFDYKVSIRDKIFNKTKYSFSVVKFIDGRLNKLKPIGSVPSAFSYKPHTVGNDSLEQELNPFFINSPSFKNDSVKIIVVLNQLNIRYLKGLNSMGGKKEDLLTTISLDYYKVTGNVCFLLYQQYYKKLEDVTFSSPTKGINNAFSEIVKISFQDFDNQLKNNQPINSVNIDTIALFSCLYNKPEQLVNSQILKDGIYFSCKDLYLNKPTTADVVFPDTTTITTQPVFLKGNNYIVDRAYAIVHFNRIFVYTENHLYKEAFFDANNQLYFQGITKTSISKGAAAGSLFFGLARVFLPVGFVGSIALDATKGAIKESGTTRIISDVIIDFETGDLTFKE